MAKRSAAGAEGDGITTKMNVCDITVVVVVVYLPISQLRAPTEPCFRMGGTLENEKFCRRSILATDCPVLTPQNSELVGG